MLLAAPSARAQEAEAVATATEQEQADEDADRKNVEFVGIPVPDYNGVLGWGLGVFAAALYRVDPDDEDSQPSMTALGGFYAQNETWFWGIGQRLSLHGDRFRAGGGYGQGDFNFQFFPGNFVPELPADLVIPFNTQGSFAFGEFSTKVWRKLYLGAKYRWAEAATEFDVGRPDGRGVALPTRTFSGLGPAASYDSRDNVFNASEGTNLEYSTRFDRPGLGSGASFETTEIKLNNYFTLREGNILAARAFIGVATGDVPFEGQFVFGGIDLRGYNQGEFRGNEKYAFQGEYRWNFYGRLGLVAFGGFGWVATDGEFSPVLPSIGTGFRFRAAQQYNVNIGVDVAKGRNDWSLRFALGEAF
ncbi:MAG: BamA/TamA family outer membrane protein [Chloroflexi bacterium]|nr:BamA/TamA family outer membrane protein [Chloroflexota bacterium]